ncbi:MAG: [FeFe] hydrogenase H-cluster maturation GTPase HydF [Firmicutes bacterium HGW-Firmicutes-1]|jgi:[FeFe] hydrogenase H-cluster maturation GTPase HydF|nr:MAG: [FeFe] hydrogenase H-cluster maturation GTPase HydF [Firmicutes bacterium HGW-Firmicutes-1]
MSLNNTPRSNRIHIAFFGRRNAGKSSIINAVTGQDLALVSEVLGTTTDPVYKSMELLPLGPVVMIDTAGLDDEGQLGELRVAKTREVMKKTDIAIIVIDSTRTEMDLELEWIQELKEKKIPIVGALNKIDLLEDVNKVADTLADELKIPLIQVSAITKKGIHKLKEKMALLVPEEQDKFCIVGDLIRPGDLVILVTPIDKAAPKGRLILPQQQTIRDILESDAIAIVTKEHELRDTFDKLNQKPKLVITDSQAFLKVAADTPPDVMMTSFSILFARYKGDLEQMVAGVKAIEKLQDGDKILICEACTHHKQSDDIGTVKIPRWIRQKTGKNIQFDHLSGNDFDENLEGYQLIIHCGGCMLNAQAMKGRMSEAKKLNVNITNYGVVIAYVHGILDRALEPFPMAKLTYNRS